MQFLFILLIYFLDDGVKKTIDRTKKPVQCAELTILAT